MDNIRCFASESNVILISMNKMLNIIEQRRSVAALYSSFIDLIGSPMLDANCV